jgi:hypothetical protein
VPDVKTNATTESLKVKNKTKTEKKKKTQDEHFNEYLSDLGMEKGLSSMALKVDVIKEKKLKFKMSGIKIKTAAHQKETHHINIFNMQKPLTRKRRKILTAQWKSGQKLGQAIYKMIYKWPLSGDRCSTFARIKEMQIVTTNEISFSTHFNQ